VEATDAARWSLPCAGPIRVVTANTRSRTATRVDLVTVAGESLAEAGAPSESLALLSLHFPASDKPCGARLNRRQCLKLAVALLAAADAMEGGESCYADPI